MAKKKDPALIPDALTLEILLRAYCQPHALEHLNSVKWLKHHKMIGEIDGYTTATEKGEQHIKALLSVPVGRKGTT